jgi:hypothetical protein
MHAHNFKDLIGLRFNRLTVVRRTENYKNGRANQTAWRCLCDCGSELIVKAGHLSSGHTKSCGCFKLERLRKKIGFASRLSVLRNYQRKARKRNLSWELSDDQFTVLTSSICYYCGDTPRNKCEITKNGCFVYNGIDRVNNSLGYRFDNVVPCCKICNGAKSSLSYTDFINWIKRIQRHGINDVS